MAESEKLGLDGFSTLFGRFNQTFLAQQEGLSLLILTSGDAIADAAAFSTAKIATSPVMTFEREGQQPDGGTVKVGFSLAFARDTKAPGIGFAACQHHHPENVWNPALQQHPNTAAGIAGVVMVADNPSDHHVFLSAFVGERELRATSSGITLKTPRGDIQVMNPAAFRSHFGIEPPDVATGARIAALRVAVRNPASTRELIGKARFAIAEPLGRIVVLPQGAMGAAIAFEAA
jgi:hypothetical protein